MEVTIRRSLISGKVKAPRSVPHAHRAIAVAGMCPDQSLLSGIPSSLELGFTMNVARSFGADIKFENGVADILGTEILQAVSKSDCGPSYATLALFLPVACLLREQSSFFGAGSLAKKPLAPLAGYLERLGATTSLQNSLLPFVVAGPIKETEIVYPAALGTQFFSGLVLACSIRGEDTAIGIDGSFATAHSESMLDLLAACGVEFIAREPDFVMVQGGGISNPLKNYQVPASPYLSSFLSLAGATSGRVAVEGTGENNQLSNLLASFGATASSSEKSFTSSTAPLSGVEFDAANLGEYLPHAMVLSSLSHGESRIKNLPALPVRQKNRMRLLMAALSKMGASFEETGVELHIKGGKLGGAVLDCKGDHVTAMALSVAALSASTPTTLTGAECVNNRYPSFFKDLSSLGAIIR